MKKQPRRLEISEDGRSLTHMIKIAGQLAKTDRYL